MNIQKDVPLAPHTTFKTGGTAEYFCEVSTKEELVECIDWSKKEKIKKFCLGGGSNILVNDTGYKGLVIKIKNSDIFWEENFSVSGAGIPLAQIITEAKARGLGGMEWAFGIPATLGGAVRNNAGAYGQNMAEQVVEVEIFDLKKERFVSLKKDDCRFSYHRSIFHEKPDWIIWEIKLEWMLTDKKIIQDKINDYLARRKEKQPLEYPSAGSFFRNPDEKTPAGLLIEKAGLKGKGIGGARVSKKHANFIINTGNATTEDIAILASIIKQKVRTKFGVQLHEEVEYVGF